MCTAVKDQRVMHKDYGIYLQDGANFFVDPSPQFLHFYTVDTAFRQVAGILR